jgi:DNA recombination protein RmuC
MDWLFLITGLIAGIGLGYLLFRLKVAAQKSSFLEEKANIEKERDILRERLSDQKEAFEKLSSELDAERQKTLDIHSRFARQENENTNLLEKLQNQKSEIEELQKKFTTEFENIAHKILKENTQEFTLVSHKNMSDILNPLKEKILNFEKKVEDTYQKGLKDQTDLQAELKKLFELNARISEEANNLTKALKSDSKKQGNWGEVVLERVLERSGLVKGQEYETQIRTTDADGRGLQPDVIIKLPENKHIIIDAKVSLVAYEAYSSSDDPESQALFLKQHVESIKTHVKGLSEKNYQHAGGFDTPDFVLLFMPVEPAFSSAIQADIGLFNFAWERKIVIVSPSTLLATLRTVASIWKHEKQTQNALDIARQGGALYDKFVGFLKNLEEIGSQIERLSKTYEEAKNKMTDGRGNLIRQVESLKILGAKTTKSIPDSYLDNNNN